MLKTNRGKFLWGASTAAAQIEGGYNKGGKSLTIWDEASLNGHIRDGHSTFDACNCYENPQADIDFLKELGATAYRFSISWARILPNGTGEINREGVKYYDTLINGLIENNIEPFVTLYHWDLPLCLQKKGGFLNNEFPQWFSYYAKKCAELFGDRVKYFSPFNEPECICYLGYGTGGHAPYIKGGTEAATYAAHNLLVANGLALREIKSAAKTDPKVGIVLASAPRIPKTEKDEEAARKATFDVCYYDSDSLFNNTHFTDPICFGNYPEYITKRFSRPFRFSGCDMDIIKCDLDFIGLNLYQGVYASDDGNGGYYDPLCGANNYKSQSGANFTPKVAYYGPKFFFERYGLPVYITENGLSLTDIPGLDGIVHDDSRVRFINDHVENIVRAIKDGVDIRGYFHWSLYDNLEWNSGFSSRFGLIHTDFKTFEKTPKDSYRFYKVLIEKFKEI